MPVVKYIIMYDTYAGLASVPSFIPGEIIKLFCVYTLVLLYNNIHSI